MKNILKLKEVINYSDSLYIIRLDKPNFSFVAGQHVKLNIKGEDKSRIYSIASGTSDSHLDVLIREIKKGDLSIRFRQLSIGSEIEVANPVGYFILPESLNENNIVCIATGSGIAPFVSFCKSYPNKQFTIIHGISNLSDSLEKILPNNVNYVTCTTKSDKGCYSGRVTSYVKEQSFGSDDMFYLCGNGEMISDVYSHLKNIGISRNAINYEEYFNN